MLPKRDGFAVLKAARQRRVDARPVLILTARDSVADKVRGLDLGRRRLPDQAVRLRRVPGAGARAAAAGAGSGARPCSALADLTLDPATREVVRGAAVASRSPRASTRCSSTSCATPAACSRGRCSPSTCGASTSIPRATSSTSTSATCGARSTARGEPRLAPHGARRRLRAAKRRAVTIAVRSRSAPGSRSGTRASSLVILVADQRRCPTRCCAGACSRTSTPRCSPWPASCATPRRAAGTPRPPDPSRWLRELLGPEHRQALPAPRPRGPTCGSVVAAARRRAAAVARRRATNASRGPAHVRDGGRSHGQRGARAHDAGRRGGRLVELVQVGMPLAPTRSRRSRRYLETLLVLVPLGVGAGRGRRLAHGAARARGRSTRCRSAARRISAEDAEPAHRAVAAPATSSTAWPRRSTAMLGPAGGHVRRDAPLRGRRRARAAHAAHRAQGRLEVALRADRSRRGVPAVLASSLEEVERLIRLAEDLLLLSRSTAGPECTARAGRPGAARARGARGRRAAGQGPRRDGARRAAIAPLAVLGDAGALRRALLNLVENAVKYTPAGGTRRAVAGAPTGADAVVVVEDTGLGIDPADADADLRAVRAARRRPAPARPAAAGSAWPSPARSSSPTAARSPSSAGRRRRRFTIRLPRA